MLLGDLQSKDVVNVVDGSKLGKITDMEIEASSGKIISIVVQPYMKVINFFSNSNSVIIPWNQIIKIGGEVVIVNHNKLGK